MSQQQQQRYATGPTALMAAGAILVAIVVIKGLVGFYTSDLAWMLPLAVVGGVCVFAARKWSERL